MILANKTRTCSAFFGYDPEPGVPMDVTPMAQCAFESSVFKVSAVHTNYRSWLRSSSIHEPSDPPIRLEYFVQSNCIEKINKNEKNAGGASGHSSSLKPHANARHGS